MNGDAHSNYLRIVPAPRGVLRFEPIINRNKGLTHVWVQTPSRIGYWVRLTGMENITIFSGE